ncbi:MAG: PfkB family carbohydrate kinase [Actinomycetota bacterium]|nr:PfkB family carbohydrate kinase [Actinomycetota bacterium]
MSEPAAPGDICVFAPAPLLTVTIEQATNGEAELHVHCGGQGFWVARMIQTLGASLTLCASFGGETGSVARHLVEEASMSLRGTSSAHANPAYVQDRRSGERQEVVKVPAGPLTRHDIDDLYSATLTASLAAKVCVLTGTQDPEVLSATVYRRLATDLGSNGVMVLADLSGEQLRQALQGGIRMLKVSEDELVDAGWATSDDEPGVIDGLKKLREAGAQEIVVSRGSKPAMALVDDTLVAVDPPSLEPVDTRGSGDSMTAALAVALSRELGADDALRFAAAAATLNITRRGLGSGQRTDMEHLADRIQLRTLDEADES